MIQKEFIELSEQQVNSLNGHGHDLYNTESWRGGYLYLVEKIRGFYETKFNEDFIDAMQKIIDDDLSEFENQD